MAGPGDASSAWCGRCYDPDETAVNWGSMTCDDVNEYRRVMVSSSFHLNLCHLQVTTVQRPKPNLIFLTHREVREPKFYRSHLSNILYFYTSIYTCRYTWGLNLNSWSNLILTKFIAFSHHLGTISSRVSKIKIRKWWKQNNWNLTKKIPYVVHEAT